MDQEGFSTPIPLEMAVTVFPTTGEGKPEGRAEVGSPFAGTSEAGRQGYRPSGAAQAPTTSAAAADRFTLFVRR